MSGGNSGLAPAGTLGRRPCGTAAVAASRNTQSSFISVLSGAVANPRAPGQAGTTARRLCQNPDISLPRHLAAAVNRRTPQQRDARAQGGPLGHVFGIARENPPDKILESVGGDVAPGRHLFLVFWPLVVHHPRARSGDGPLGSCELFPYFVVPAGRELVG